jgi:hypothetical protein
MTGVKKYTRKLYEGKIMIFLLSKSIMRVNFIIFYPRINNKGKIYPRYLLKIDHHLGGESGEEKWLRRDASLGK